jgi:AcrR family transcriptional regulator
MPKTRSDQARDEKVAEITAAAERRLREGGWESLSVASIARELGVAQNAIYWYFPSKDHVFVATLERILTEVVARKPGRSHGDIERILWFTDQFNELGDLRAAMHERARRSPVVADFVRRLDRQLSRMLTGVLREHVDAVALPLAVESVRATVDGTFTRQLSKRERHRVLRYALERIVSPPPAKSTAH